MRLATQRPQYWDDRYGPERLNGIPNADQEALQEPDWDPVAAAVAGLTGGSTFPQRAVAAASDAFAQGLTSSSLPSWVSWPAALAVGVGAGHLTSKDAARVANEVGAVGKDVGDYIDVWHASPHKFDKFDSTRIGTGEGSQYRGYGLYFAENPEVSGLGSGVPSAYDRLFLNRARDLPTYPGTDPAVDMAVVDMLRQGSPWEQQYLKDVGRHAGISPELVDFWAQNKPSIYQVRLHKPSTDFLDLDSNLTQDLVYRLDPDTRARLDRFGRDKLEGSFSKYSSQYDGLDLYKALMASANAQKEVKRQKFDSPEYIRAVRRAVNSEVSQKLTNAGFAGTKFLDALSRIYGGGNTQNYVMFPGNDDAIEILKRYGITLPMAQQLYQQYGSDQLPSQDATNPTAALSQGLIAR